MRVQREKRERRGQTTVQARVDRVKEEGILYTTFCHSRHVHLGREIPSRAAKSFEEREVVASHRVDEKTAMHQPPMHAHDTALQ